MTPQERKTWVRRMGARRAWWDRRREAIVEPGWEVVDTHVHLWDERDFPDPAGGGMLRTSRYLLDEFLRDTASGHRVAQCVYVECGSGCYADGPDDLRPVGEAEFASALAERLAASQSATRIGAVVAHADLRNPELERVLDAHEDKGRGLVRAIRHSGARLDDPSARLLAGAAPPRLYADPAFRRGVAVLGGRGLAFDAFQ